MDKSTDRWKDAFMDGWTVGQMNIGQMNGEMDRQMDSQRDGWMDGQMEVE